MNSSDIRERLKSFKPSKRTKNRIFKSTIALTLGAIMAFSNPLDFLGQGKEAVRLQKEAEKNLKAKANEAVKVAKAAETDESTDSEEIAEDINYVSDIKIFNYDSKSDCKEALQNSGYKVFDQDLNEHCGGDYVYLGYKTSKNKEDAITDIRQLHMGVGNESTMPYGYIDCQRVISDKQDQFTKASSSLMIALKEYSQKLYEDNSKFAKQARDLLNVYTVDEDGEQPLGDYLASANVSTDVLSKMLLESNGDVPITVYTAIFRGVQDIDKDNTWADRTVKCDFLKYISNSEEGEGVSKNQKLLDGKYYSMAEELSKKIKEFATNYNDAEQRIENNGGKIDEKDENASTDAVIIANKDILNQYEFPKDAFSANADVPHKLGDFLVYVGSEKDNSISLADETGLRMLYPVVAALTQGQFEMLKINSISSAVSYMLDSDKADAKFKSRIEELTNKLKENTGKKFLWIYYGVDKSAYKDKVAVTSAARREDAAGKSFLQAQENKAKKEKFINEVTTGLRLTMEIVSITSSVIFLASTITSKVVSAMAASAFMAANGAGATAAAAAAAGTQAVAASSVCCWLGIATTAFFWIGIALLVALIIWSIICFWVADQKYDEDNDRSETLNNIYDIRKIDDESHYIFYDGIKDQNGKTADINNGDGERWSSLFYTKDTRVGSPLCVNENGDLFTMRDESGYISGYTPLKHFESKSPENIKKYSDDTDYEMFLHYITLSSLGKGENKGETTNSEDEYLYDIMEISAENDEDARNQLMAKGFDYIDENISPKNKFSTYVGYKTTKNKKNAIRDIRVSSNTTASKMYYSNAGYSGSGGSNTYNIIYWTKKESAGTPILAKDFKITNKMLAKDSGWEPVCQLGGGAPFNFNCIVSEDNEIVSHKAYPGYTEYHILGDKIDVGDGVYDRDVSANYNTDKYDYDKYDFTPKYIYFKPETTYTSGTEYISGFATVCGYPYEDYSLDERLKLLGYTPFDEELAPENCYGKTVQDVIGTNAMTRVRLLRSNYSVKMGYCTTYNPYRAIRDIKIKRGTSLQEELDATTVYGEYSYAACPVYVSLDYTINWKFVSEGRSYYESIPEDQRDAVYLGEDSLYKTGFTISKANAYLTPSMYDPAHNTVFNENEGLASPIKYIPSKKDKEYITYNSGRIRPQNLFVTTGDDSLGEPIKLSDISFSKGKPFNPESGYENVREFTNQYDLDGLSISVPKTSESEEENKKAEIYMGVKKSEEIEEKPYISMVYGNSFEMPEKNSDGKALTDEERKFYKKLIDDQAMQQVLSSGCGEVIMTNTAMESGTAWYDDEGAGLGYPKAEIKEASYIGVKRTSSLKSAVTGIIRYFIEKDERPAVELKVDGVVYTRGGEAIKTMDGDCYIYYTNSKLVNSGRPLMDISIDRTVYSDGYVNAPCMSKYSKTHYDENTYFTFNCKFGRLENSVVNKIYLAKADTEKEAKIELSRKGVDRIIDVDLNRGTDGLKVYLGYTTIPRGEAIDYLKDVDCASIEEVREEWLSDPELSKEEAKELEDYIESYKMVFDVKCKAYYKTETPLPSFTQNGLTYHLVSNVSLNEGCEGKAVKDIYLYACNDYIDLTVNGQGEREPDDPDNVFNSAISDLSLCSGDIIPVNRLLWEGVYDTEGKRADVNDSVFGGVISETDKISEEVKNKVSDVRLYLFSRRFNSYILNKNTVGDGWSQDTIQSFN
ncbi:MAG: hypothetical protein K6D02_01550, partial [Lachnospiraceae bacterium]|nr:hypothetical protein [Lachnospiraceae bacterium]